MIGSRKTVTIDTLDVSFIEHGTGRETILFLHGWGGSALSFQPLWEQMVSLGIDENKRFIAIDFPGFGETASPPVAWEVRDYLDCVVKYINSQKLATVSVVCHSFGGRVLTKWLVSDHQDRVNKAVFIAPAVKRHQKKVAHAIASAGKAVFHLPLLRSVFPLVRTVGYKLIGGHDYMNVDGVMKETFQLVTEEDPSPQLTRISKPSLVFWGSNDTYVPVSDAELMKQSMQVEPQVIIFPDGRHGIHKTHATQISHTLNAFL